MSISVVPVIAKVLMDLKLIRRDIVVKSPWLLE